MWPEHRELAVTDLPIGKMAAPERSPAQSVVAFTEQSDDTPPREVGASSSIPSGGFSGADGENEGIAVGVARRPVGSLYLCAILESTYPVFQQTCESSIFGQPQGLVRQLSRDPVRERDLLGFVVTRGSVGFFDPGEAT